MITQGDIDYVVEIVALNPVVDAEQIISRRGQHIAPDSKEEKSRNPVAATSSERRRICRDEIHALRDQFWSLDQQTLLDRLQRLDSSEFAELRVACRTLESTATRLQAFQRLQEHPHSFPLFVDSLKRIAITNPLYVAALRKKLRDDARTGVEHRERRSRQDFYRLAETIEFEFPEIATLYGSLLREIRDESSQDWRLLVRFRAWVGPVLPVLAAIVIISISISVLIQAHK